MQVLRFDVIRSLTVLFGLLAFMVVPGPVAAQSTDQVRRRNASRRSLLSRTGVSPGRLRLPVERGSFQAGRRRQGWRRPLPGLNRRVPPPSEWRFWMRIAPAGIPMLLEAAKETAGALIRGQLESGGWDNLIEFDPRAAIEVCLPDRSGNQ